MSLVKARIQGNAVVVTIPKTFHVKPGTEFSFKKGENGSLILTPSKKIPATMEELFKNWHGVYQMPEDLKEWDNAKPEGEELWWKLEAGILYTLTSIQQLVVKFKKEDQLLL